MRSEQEIKASVHKHVCSLRCIERVVMTEAFSSAFDKATDDEKKELDDYITRFKEKEIASWVRKVNVGSLHFMSYRRLRALAKEHNVYLWSRKLQDELIEDLERILKDESSVE